MVSATVAANGMNARTANLPLPQEPQTSTFSSNSTTLFQRQGHDTIKLAFPPFFALRFLGLVIFTRLQFEKP